MILKHEFLFAAVLVIILIVPPMIVSDGHEERSRQLVDLAVEDIWYDENLTVSCRIASLGAPYSGTFNVNLTVDGYPYSSDVQIMSGWTGYMNVTFQQRISWEGELVEVMVNIYDPQWPEDDDTSNDQRTEVWERNLPDLWITSLYSDPVSENATAVVENHGETAVLLPFNTTLEVNGTERSRVSEERPLEPGERTYIDLRWSWNRSRTEVNLVVKVDPEDRIDETDELDNDHTITWKVRPDLAFLSAPSVTEIGTNTASVSWSASVPVDAVIEYGTSSALGSNMTSTSMMSSGHFDLSGLEPSTMYIFRITATSEFERSVQSSSRTFTTEAGASSSETTGDFDEEMMMDLEGMVEIPFSSSDPMGINKVDIYVDGKLKKSIAGMGKSSVSKLMMDVSDLAPGEHTMMAKVKNRIGQTMTFTSEMSVSSWLERRYPKIEFEPSEGDRSGTVFLYARCTDPVGITNVSWYVDGEEVHFQTPVSSVRTFFGASFNWDSTEVYDGDHVVAVTARNDEGNTSTVVRDITVKNHIPPADPNVGVTRLNMRRTGSVVTMPLRVGNWGAGPAVNVMISDIMKGYIPADENRESYSWTSDGRIWVSKIFIPRLEPGEIINVEYRCVPALLSEEDEQVIGYGLNYPDDDTIDPVTTAIRYYREDTAVRYFKTRNLPPTQFTTGEFMAAGSESAIEYADYMLLTCPYRLEENFGEARADDLIMTAAELAAEKHGVLGFMVRSLFHGTALSREDVYTQLQEWAPRMHPYFTEYGYLAIIGENNIIPTWTYEDVVNFRGEDDPRDVPLSDHGYMNLEGGNVPKIAVGRFIGSTYDEVVAPMEVSLDEAQGTLENDHSGDALLISGAGNSVQSFRNHLEYLRGDLVRNMDSARLIEKSHSLVERTMSHYFDGNYKHLAAGNLDFDSMGEIVVTRYGYSAYVLEDSGSVSDFYHYIQEGDVVLCGNVHGDDRDEIIFIETGARGGRARATNKVGDEQIDMDISWEAGDPICAGDYDSDGMDELIYAKTSSDELIVMDFASGEIDRFSVEDVRPGDRIGITDMDADSEQDVVIADMNDDMVRVYRAPGWDRFDIDVGDLDESDAFSVGFYSGNGSGGRAFVLHPDIDGHTNEIFMQYDEDEEEWSGKGVKSYMTPVRSSCAAVVTEYLGNGDYEEVVLVEAGSSNNIRILDYQRCSSRFRAELDPHMDELDLIVYSDHGYTRGWSGTYHFDQVPGWGMNTWTHRPVIYSAACSTGDYVYTDDSMAVTCLREGAAVFIGATQTSQISENNLAMPFVGQYSAGVPIGVAFKNYKASLVSGDLGVRSCLADLWAYQYNLYGDPAFGTPTGAVPSRSLAPVPKRSGTTQQIEIDHPVFLNHTGEKEVLLQGHLVLREDGKPAIPYIKRTVEIPIGFSPVNVSLRPLAEWHHYYDLDIRRYVVGEFAGEHPPSKQGATEYPDTSWWEPGVAFEYYFRSDMAESGTLVLDIFPFQYNEGAMVGRFCPLWELTYDLVEAPAMIAEVKGPSGPQEFGTVGFDVTLEPIGEGGRVWIAQRIESSIDGHLVEELPGSIIDINHTTELEQNWTYNGPLRSLLYIVELMDNEGVIMDEVFQGLRFGSPDVMVSSFRASPGDFDENTTLDITLELENGGDIPASGLLEVDVLGPVGEGFRELHHMNLTLIPDQEPASFNYTLNGGDLQDDLYFLRASFISDMSSVSRLLEIRRNGTIPKEEPEPTLDVLYNTSGRSFVEAGGIWVNGTVMLSNSTVLPGVGVGIWIGENGTKNATLSGEDGTFSLYLDGFEAGNHTVSILVSAGVLEFTDSFEINVLEPGSIVDDDTTDDDDTSTDDDTTDDDDTSTDDDAADDDGEGSPYTVMGLVLGVLVVLLVIAVVLLLARKAGPRSRSEEE